MEKENSGGSADNAPGGTSTSASAASVTSASANEKIQADQANPLLDPTTALFGGELHLRSPGLTYPSIDLPPSLLPPSLTLFSYPSIWLGSTNQ